jgi:ribulose-5-phosphate 4-epimerase/fuculose-1-phosphate aldolase
MSALNVSSLKPVSLRTQVSAEEWRVRVALAASYRLLAEAGVSDLTYNHVSARVPGEPDNYLIKSEDELFDEVTASSLVKYNLRGDKLSNNPGHVSRGGLVIHAGVLEARPDLGAVFHTHTSANIAVGAQKFGLLPLSQHSYNRVGYHDFKGFEFDIEGRARLVADLGANNKILTVRNHGVLVVGETVGETHVEHVLFETACRAQVASLSAGSVDPSFSRGRGGRSNSRATDRRALGYQRRKTRLAGVAALPRPEGHELRSIGHDGVRARPAPRRRCPDTRCNGKDVR